MKVNNIEMKEPLFITRDFQNSKQIAILAHNLYRWKLMDISNPKNNAFEILINNAFRWLYIKEKNKNVNIKTTKTSYAANEPVEFIGNVYDQNFVPIENASVSIEIKSDDDRREITLQPIGNGRYFTKVEGLNKGDFSWNAKAAVESRAIGADNGRFSIGEIAIEYANLKQNVSLLKTLSDRTTGIYWNAEDIIRNNIDIATEITNSTNWTEKSVANRFEFLVWNWWFLLITSILLFSVEWFIRKRAGLI
jgi:hypothetical protein